jgi:hypothetical protein
MTVIDWHEEVKEFRRQYDNDDDISEYIDSMLPHYYSEIYTAYHEAIGTPLNIEIHAGHVGLTIDRIMLGFLFENYFDSFMSAWNEVVEEEE